MRIFILALTAIFLAVPAFADSDRDCQVVAEAINPTETQATDDFVNLTDGTFSAVAGVAGEDEFIVPVDVKVWGLSVDVDVAPTADDTWLVSVFDDAATTLVTCSITGATDTSCENMSNVATIAKGSDLMVVVDSGTGTGDPAAAAEIRFAFCISKN